MYCLNCGKELAEEVAFCGSCGHKVGTSPAEEAPVSTPATATVPVEKQKTKRSKLLLVSGFLGIAYLVYIVSYFFGSLSAASGAEAIGGALATMLVIPHIFMVGLSVIFTWVGYGVNARWAALVAGILYCIGALLMFIYAPFILLQLIFSFVAFAKMKKPAQN